MRIDKIRDRFSKLYLSFLLGLALLGSPVPASSAPIALGFDLFHVIEGSTSIDLSSVFPGAGIVFSNGVNFLGLGNASTGLQRTQPLPPLSIGQTVNVAIEFVVEHSLSVNPVDRAPFGLGTGLADFHTIINRGGILPYLPNTDGLVSPSVGSMTITRTVANGGTFVLNLDINPLVVS